MPKYLNEEVRIAIKYIEECKGLHENWVLFAEKNPKEMKRLETMERVAGNKEFHELWVEKYNFVIDVLERVM